MRVLLVDDHALFAQSLAIVLSDYPSVEQFSSIRSVGEIERTIEKNKPDILLMDINLGKMSEEMAYCSHRLSYKSIRPRKLLFCRDTICLFIAKKLKSWERKVLSTRTLNRKNCCTFWKQSIKALHILHAPAILLKK